MPRSLDHTDMTRHCGSALHGLTFCRCCGCGIGQTCPHFCDGVHCLNYTQPRGYKPMTFLATLTATFVVEADTADDASALVQSLPLSGAGTRSWDIEQAET